MSYSKLLLLAVLPACIYAAVPVVTSGGIVNAASYAPGIAPGAWLSIFGSNLASTTASAGVGDLVNGFLPTLLRGTSVTINGKPAYLNFVSPGQLNVQAPADTVTGPVQVVVTTAEGSASATAIEGSVQPGVFQLGSYAAAVRPGDATIINGTGSAISGYATASAAKPGDVLSVYATGLGATTTSVAPGQVFSGSYPTSTLPSVLIGGTSATVTYAGLVAAGLYQINVTVPSTLTSGTYPLAIVQNGVSSPAGALLNVVPSTAAATTLTLTSSAPSILMGNTVTLTATISPASTTGTVSFYEGPVPIGTGTLSNGVTTLSTSFAPGTHAVTAVFGTATATSAVTSLATLVTVNTTGTSSDCSFNTGSPQMVCLANAFLATLSTTQQSTVLYSYTLANVEHWSNLPISLVPRYGLRFGDLSSTQRAAALAMAQAAMSTDGLDRMGKIRGADEVINPLNTGMQWGAANYYIAFYGTPSVTNPWMLQLAGHHFAVNRTYNGKYTSGSPFFLGTEPASYTVNGTVYTPQEKQRAAMYALNQTLLSNSAAKLSGTFDDVVMGVGQGGTDTNFPQNYPTTNRGVLLSTLSSDQQSLVKRAIEAWVSDLDPAAANELLAIYEDPAALANTYVGYSGSGSMVTVGDYIRVDGPRVWAEFVVQSGIAYRNSYHYHSIWRDKTADYGGDFQ